MVEKASKLNKSEEILTAALELFTAKGFDGTAVPLIAERANVAAGTIYRYFASKEELVNSLFQKWQESLYNKIKDNFPENVEPKEQFHRIWLSMAEFQRENPIAFDFLEMQYNLPYLDKKSLAKRALLLKFLTRFAHDNRDILIKFPPDALIAIVWGAFVGLVKGSRNGKIKLDDQFLKESEDLLWNAIKLPN
ncbi:TetR/AcrR family transcriptional regulator [Leptospira biflexa]|uniref:Transcriptional regulator, TetR family n=1 Tax=Leptospira biflexa serovar Patoc (strain Patoc 1 / ATCC 23582 / Paris) TaxID=456481 RepID=B0SJS5_LEPBP|nr:Transcriptional regulator, AcrR-family [Leptospira biflexa serovar Patoc strain 'Patoc 1 (Ames)']ABZ96247.1 Transcriptional regulator, TetR family [Leptospira biflexa serovar Patoc strain 'Patoc 1 (Paris)']TGM37591.1 TetR/AcrR family transcriptional regulator [Leptospira biflexa]TGM40926.1 TetR/AcrR family transcriptional regulator [Leptospira biflexa]TGM47128.1 TetR/AcrR family transcriptional regulator [Leptospira biflexa]